MLPSFFLKKIWNVLFQVVHKYMYLQHAFHCFKFWLKLQQINLFVLCVKNLVFDVTTTQVLSNSVCVWLCHSLLCNTSFGHFFFFVFISHPSRALIICSYLYLFTMFLYLCFLQKETWTKEVSYSKNFK